jgi:Zn-dependent M28 family amino/carboxypeptidase
LRLLATELRQHVAHLAEKIGERNVLRRPRELAEAADYIQAELAKSGYAAKRQEYEVSGVACHNLEVEIIGAARPEEIVIIGAHYDSVVGTPGANDNGSGVAALLVLAQRFSGRKIGRTLRLVAFVNEEPPHFQTEEMGSWVYARRCRQRDEKVTAMLSLETIGYYSDAPGSQKYPPPFSFFYPSTGNFIGFVGNRRSGDLLNQVVASFRQHEPFPSEAGALPEFIPGVGFSDHWSFWQEGYPAVMVTDTAPLRYPHYHEPTDTTDKIDFEKLARVVRGLEKVVTDLASAF